MLASAGGALEFLPVAGPLIGGVAMLTVAMLSGLRALGLLAAFSVCLANAAGLRHFLRASWAAGVELQSPCGLVRNSLLAARLAE